MNLLFIFLKDVLIVEINYDVTRLHLKDTIKLYHDYPPFPKARSVPV